MRSARRLGMGLRLGLIFFGLFSGLLILSMLLSCSAARVIYFNKDIESIKNSSNIVDKSMLLSIQRSNCMRGFMYDHRNRCRRIV